MSMITRETSDNSVTFSLAELAKLEEERLRHEDVQRSRAREREAREQREAEARRRAEEAAQMAADASSRARRAREEAEEKARKEAREKAMVEVARIEAEGKARLEVANAERAHELAVLRVRTEGGARRLKHALAAVIAVVVCGGSAAAYAVTQHVADLEQDAERLREGQTALSRERESARATALAALDKRHAALRARPPVQGAEEARATADAAHRAIDPKAVDHERLRAFGDALDVLSARLDTLERIAALDRRLEDLIAWAAERRRSEAATAAKAAAARAKLSGTDEALRAYDTALNELRDALTRSTGSGGSQPGPEPKGPKCTDPHDPLCGFNGQSL